LHRHGSAPLIRYVHTWTVRGREEESPSLLSIRSSLRRIRGQSFGRGLWPYPPCPDAASRSGAHTLKVVAAACEDEQRNRTMPQRSWLSRRRQGEVPSGVCGSWAEVGGVLAALLALAQILCASTLMSHAATDGLDLGDHSIAEVPEDTLAACFGSLLTRLGAPSSSPNSLPPPPRSAAPSSWH
jgi:hypothetical protein